MTEFIFKGISSRDMPVKVLDVFFPTAAEQVCEEITVPGRSTTVSILKNQYKNITGKISVELRKDADFREVFEWLTGSGQLILSDDPERYYNAISVKQIGTKRVNGSYRSVSVQFTCSPFVYSLEPTTTEIATTYTEVENSGSIYSEPVITFTVIKDDNPILMGDVNEDGKVDSVDASLVMQEYVRIQTGEEPTFTERQKIAADMNGDGVIDNVDVGLIMQAYIDQQTNGGSSDNVPDKQVTIDVNGETLIIGLPSAAILGGCTVTVDSENQLLYYTDSDGNKINIMQYSYGDLPLLHTGTNYAKYSGDISDVKIKVNERWR